VIAFASFALMPYAALAQAPRSPKTPEEVMQRRVLGSIEDRVRSALETAEGELADADIEVGVSPDRIVTIAGRVPSADAKEQAGRLALYAVGVSSVDNRLQVVAPPAPPTPAVSAGAPVTDPSADVDSSHPPTDKELARRVSERIASSLPVAARAEHRWLRGWRVAGDGWSFEVDADDGAIRLDGRIREPLDVDAVVANARAVPAVRSVESSLVVVEERR